MKRRLSQHQQLRIEQRRSGSHHHTQGLEGLVVMNSGKKASVQLDEDGSILTCHQRANLANVVAGDKVIISLDDQHNPVIESLLPRNSLLSRPGFRGVIKPVAANVDQLLVVVAPAPGIDLDLLDRSLCYCEWQGLKAIIILNKVDLLAQEYRAYCDELAAIYRRMGYLWLETSIKLNTGLNELRQLCSNQSSVFLGNSGVGKSSLTQALIPDVAIRTQQLSASTGLGQHTTNNATLYELPGNGQLIDAAGIRSLELAEFAIEHPDRYWRDFRPYLGECRFNNCTHDHEPDCAIKNALEKDEISLHRYQHYLRLLHSQPS